MERTYNIPLRQEFQKAPKYRRSKRAISAVRDFLKRHMKSEIILIGKHLNELIWKNGIRNPPHHVKVTARKEDDKVYAELIGHKFEKEEKKEEKKGLKEKITNKLGVAKPKGKKEEAKKTEKVKPAPRAEEKKDSEKAPPAGKLSSN